MRIRSKSAVLKAGAGIVASAVIALRPAPAKEAGEPLLAPLEARPVRVAEMPDAQLKRVYVACSNAALHGALGTSDIPFCSLVYEALLQRTFGGDFFALLAWSRAQRDVRPERASE